LPYEKTFVGLISEKFYDKNIANLGVGSYSPSIYYAKVNYFIKQGYKFKELIVYIDISDIQDEASRYFTRKGKIYDTRTPQVEKKKVKIFPLLSSGIKGIESSLGLKALEKKMRNLIKHGQKNPPAFEGILSKNYDRAAWTYNENISGYGKLGVDGGIKKSIYHMNKLYELCQRHHIKMSVGIYPWPSQILYDVEDSRQVKIWREFCKYRCKNFINSYPTFSKLTNDSDKLSIINQYFITGDVHFNENGNKIIANDFFDSYNF
jgi:hypothetical protein